MTIEGLLQKLALMNVDPKFYSILSQPKEYAYNLEYINERYNVFYMERAERIYQKTFFNIEEANQYLYDLIKANIVFGLNLSR